MDRFDLNFSKMCNLTSASDPPKPTGRKGSNSQTTSMAKTTELIEERKVTVSSPEVNKPIAGNFSSSDDEDIGLSVTRVERSVDVGKTDGVKSHSYFLRPRNLQSASVLNGSEFSVGEISRKRSTGKELKVRNRQALKSPCLSDTDSSAKYTVSTNAPEKGRKRLSSEQAALMQTIANGRNSNTYFLRSSCAPKTSLRRTNESSVGEFAEDLPHNNSAKTDSKCAKKRARLSSEAPDVCKSIGNQITQISKSEKAPPALRRANHHGSSPYLLRSSCSRPSSVLKEANEVSKTDQRKLSITSRTNETYFLRSGCSTTCRADGLISRIYSLSYSRSRSQQKTEKKASQNDENKMSTISRSNDQKSRSYVFRASSSHPKSLQEAANEDFQNDREGPPTANYQESRTYFLRSRGSALKLPRKTADKVFEKEARTVPKPKKAKIHKLSIVEDSVCVAEDPVLMPQSSGVLMAGRQRAETVAKCNSRRASTVTAELGQGDHRDAQVAVSRYFLRPRAYSANISGFYRDL